MNVRKHIFETAAVALATALVAGVASANESPDVTIQSGDATPVYTAPMAPASQPVYSDGSQPVYAAPAYSYSSEPYVAPSDEPRYTPETGNAEYGKKLNPSVVRSFAVTPPSRFNDATGQ